MKTQDVVIAHPQTSEQVSALKAFMQALKIKFEVAKEDTYNREFVEKIEKSRKDYKEGKGKVYTTEQLNALWK
jgi:nitrogen regulatory protein PII